MKRIDLTGQRFGRLVAVAPFSKRLVSGRLRSFWECKCDCGSLHQVDTSALKRGDCQSCGCMQREMGAERATTHGRSFTKLHRAWTNIKTRCLNSNTPAYRNYGGRGIRICQEWAESFEAFAEYMGEPPTRNHSVDRWPNKDGHYEPGNVRWATSQEQGRNRNGLIEVEYQGRTMCLTEAADIAGLTYSVVYTRMFRWKWPFQKAISTPSRGLRKHA